MIIKISLGYPVMKRIVKVIVVGFPVLAVILLGIVGIGFFEI